MQVDQTSRGSFPEDISVRVVTYTAGREPEIAEVSASRAASATGKISSVVGSRIARLGGSVPERAVSEVVENLIHARYAGVVVSIMENGERVRVADRGPGITDKARAVEFGFSGASREAMGEIRGIGAGLGIALAEMKKVGGTLVIEDNLGGGTVVTLSALAGDRGEEVAPQRLEKSVSAEVEPKRHLGKVPDIDISERQERTLITVLECGEVGPSTIAEVVDVSVSTAYRDLSVLEDHGLATSTESGKRVISPLGRDYAAAIIKTWVK